VKKSNVGFDKMLNIVAGALAAGAILAPVQAVDIHTVGAGGERKLSTWGWGSSNGGKGYRSSYNSEGRRPRHNVWSPPNHQAPSCGKSGQKCCWCGANLHV
jgi:hypothetical protein